MYSISNVIVGVPITNQLEAYLRQTTDDDINWNDLGFETFYHGGSSGTQGYCGVYLSEFDECCDYIRVNPDGTLFCVSDSGGRNISLVPTSEQIAEAIKKVGNLRDDIRKFCPSFGVYIIQSTS